MQMIRKLSLQSIVGVINTSCRECVRNCIDYELSCDVDINFHDFYLVIEEMIKESTLFTLEEVTV